MMTVVGVLRDDDCPMWAVACFSNVLQLAASDDIGNALVGENYGWNWSL
jgi:hypothetical protein